MSDAPRSRYAGHYQERPTAYLDSTSGRGLDPRGRAVELGEHPTLARVLAFALAADAETVYLTGPTPGGGGQAGLETWALSPEAGTEWTDERSYLGATVGTGSGRIAEDLPVIRQRHRTHDFTCTVRRVAAWLGEGPYTPGEARTIMLALRTALRAHFGDRVVLLGTPAATGKDLWDRAHDADYPTLPDDVQAIIRHGAGQGRVELVTAPGLKRVPSFYYLDGRLMYAACAANLSGGDLVHDACPELERYTPGRYRVRFTVPRDWAHVGLFMVKRERVHDGWWYPAEPGYSGETWAGWTEVALALDRGWDVQILERLLFPKGTRPAPLDTWQRRLLTIWSEAQHELVRRAVRSILLYTIGAFARAQREETRVLRRADTHLLPTDNGTIQRTATGDWTYRELVALPERERRYQHPEWAAEIWAKCRTRMLHYAQKRGRGEVVARWGALTLPREQILAFRTDALYLTHDPQWPDDGRPGSLRLKGAIRAPVRAPHTLAEINPLRDRAEDVLRGELAR